MTLENKSPALGAAQRSDSDHAWASLQTCEERWKREPECPPGLGPLDLAGTDDHQQRGATSSSAPTPHPRAAWSASPADCGDGSRVTSARAPAQRGASSSRAAPMTPRSMPATPVEVPPSPGCRRPASSAEIPAEMNVNSETPQCHCNHDAAL